MKKALRNALATILLSPFIILVYLTSVIAGKSKAISIWGPAATFISKQALTFWVPNMASADDFHNFAKKMRVNLRLWRPMYDVEIVHENEKSFGLRVLNCPYCEVLNSVGLADLSPFVCKGDWAKAEEHKDKWVFERNNQIGTGNDFCDHTYKRI